MKRCVKSKINSEILRVRAEDSDKMVASGNWNYCPKMEWKIATGKKSAPKQETVSKEIASLVKEKKAKRAIAKKAKVQKVQKTAAELLK